MYESALRDYIIIYTYYNYIAFVCDWSHMKKYVCYENVLQTKCYEMCQQNVLHEIAIIFDMFKDKIYGIFSMWNTICVLYKYVIKYVTKYVHMPSYGQFWDIEILNIVDNYWDFEILNILDILVDLFWTLWTIWNFFIFYIFNMLNIFGHQIWFLAQLNKKLASLDILDQKELYDFEILNIVDNFEIFKILRLWTLWIILHLFIFWNFEYFGQHFLNIVHNLGILNIGIF